MPEKKFSVTLKEIIDEFSLETIHLPMDASKLLVIETEINRPGLQLSGFYEYFNNERIQIVGKAEFAYLATMEETVRKEHLEMLFAQHVPCIIITRELPYFPEMLDLAQQYEIPLLRCKDSTSSFMSALIAYLNLHLAPRITRHGVLIEIYGEGVLILGESGVGKSETAVELVKRGHRLIADDAVELRRVSSHKIMGSAPENIRHFIELRGIGIINVAKLFGMGAVRTENEINLIVNIVPWNTQEVYDRLGLEEQYMELLGVKVPMNTITITRCFKISMFL